MSINGVGSGLYMGETYEERLSKITDKNAASAFQAAYAKKMAGSTDYISTVSKAYSTGKPGATNFADAFPMYDVITHVGNPNVSSSNWQRNDFPFWKYFQKNTSADALNDWRPKGANPPQTRADLQSGYSSVGSGRMAVLVPESLQQKMDADPAYARQIMAKLQEWKEDYDRWDNTVAASFGGNVAEFQAGKSYVFQLDEEGNVKNCTVTSPGRITGPSREELEQIEAERAKKWKRRVKYIELMKESAEKAKLREQENLQLYQSQLAKRELLGLADTGPEEESISDAGYHEKALASVGPNAPEEVKNAWMEAAEEVGANGLGMKENGMFTHISQMLVQQVINAQNGKPNPQDVLGNSVQSALLAARKALDALENPLRQTGQRSPQVQQLKKKEAAFYKAFISKLETII